MRHVTYRAAAPREESSVQVFRTHGVPQDLIYIAFLFYVLTNDNKESQIRFFSMILILYLINNKNKLIN